MKPFKYFLKEAHYLDNLNPTGGFNVDWDPKSRATAPLAKNMTTLDKTMGGKPTDSIVIFRGTQGKKIVPGDFVTTIRDLALTYAGGVPGLSDPPMYNLLSKRVKKGDILDDLDEPLGDEYIYRPNAYKEITNR